MANDYFASWNNAIRKEFLQLTQKQEEELLKAYVKAGNELAKKLEITRGPATKAYISTYMKSIAADINTIISKYNIEASSLGMKFSELLSDEAKKKGIYWNGVFLESSRESVERVIKGQIYKDGIGLSDRIWMHSSKIGNNLNEIVAKEFAKGTSAKKLADAVSPYVNPLARKIWDNKDNPVVKLYGNVEYNSMRLARTTLNHSFQASNKINADKNPYIEGLQWHTSAQHSTRMHGRTDICDERNGQVFSPKECPFDHPNGMCYQTPYIPKSIDEIGDELKAWVNGEENERLDNWYKDNWMNTYFHDTYKPREGTGVIQARRIDNENVVVHGQVYKVNQQMDKYINQYNKCTSLDELADVYDKVAEQYRENWKDRATVDTYHFFEKMYRTNEEIAKIKAPKEYLLAVNQKDAEVLGNVVSSGWLQSVSTEEKYALRRYTGSNSLNINESLRNGNADTDSKDLIDKVSSAMSKNKLKENVVVFRGSSFDILGTTDIESMVGKTVADKAFLSTTLNPQETFGGGLKMEILVPKGTNGIYVESITAMKSEQEILLDKNLQLKVLDAWWDDDGTARLSMKVIGGK